MSQADRKRRERRQDAIRGGWEIAKSNVALSWIARYMTIEPGGVTGADAWAQLNLHGKILTNPERDGEPAEWAWVFAHLLLHTGLGHIGDELLDEARAIRPNGDVDPVYSVACCMAVNRFAEVLKVGREPFWLPALPGGNELSLTSRWRETGVPKEFVGYGTAGSQPCLVPGPPLFKWQKRPGEDWTAAFAKGLTDAAADAMTQAAEARGQVTHKRQRQVWDRALGWFVSSFPLRGRGGFHVGRGNRTGMGHRHRRGQR